MKTALPPILESKLADFRRRVWVVKVLEGILAGLVGLLGSWLVLFNVSSAFKKQLHHITKRRLSL